MSTDQPTPVETTYQVVVEHTVVHRVTAATPEDAAALVYEGDGNDHPKFMAVSVRSVVTADGYWTDEDLRAPLACRGGCGRRLPADQGDECARCYLDRLTRERPGLTAVQA